MAIAGNDATGDCNNCRHWRGMANRRPGVRIPNPAYPSGPKFGFGKCLRPGGHCQPRVVR
jgi:hypothetical protein